MLRVEGSGADESKGFIRKRRRGNCVIGPAPFAGGGCNASAPHVGIGTPFQPADDLGAIAEIAILIEPEIGIALVEIGNGEEFGFSWAKARFRRDAGGVVEAVTEGKSRFQGDRFIGHVGDLDLASGEIDFRDPEIRHRSLTGDEGNRRDEADKKGVLHGEMGFSKGGAQAEFIPQERNGERKR